MTTGGTIFARGHLLGEVPEVRAHLECSGLILAERGSLHAIPELEARGPGWNSPTKRPSANSPKKKCSI